MLVTIVNEIVVFVWNVVAGKGTYVRHQEGLTLRKDAKSVLPAAFLIWPAEDCTAKIGQCESVLIGRVMSHLQGISALAVEFDGSWSSAESIS